MSRFLVDSEMLTDISDEGFTAFEMVMFGARIRVEMRGNLTLDWDPTDADPDELVIVAGDAHIKITRIEE